MGRDPRPSTHAQGKKKEKKRAQPKPQGAKGCAPRGPRGGTSCEPAASQVQRPPRGGACACAPGCAPRAARGAERGGQRCRQHCRGVGTALASPPGAGPGGGRNAVRAWGGGRGGGSSLSLRDSHRARFPVSYACLSREWCSQPVSELFIDSCQLGFFFNFFF